MKENDMKCRFCNSALHHTFADLGMSPLANSYLSKKQAMQMEPFYPLHAYVCEKCFLVQLPMFETSENIFSDYAYFSSYAESMLKHAKDYVDMVVARLELGTESRVVELASNDGYLLQYFKEYSVPVLGIEPAQNVAEVAIQKGIPTSVKFFGVETAKELAREGKYADLMLGNNVLAHVPDLNDFVAGMKILLKPQGVITIEFPHLAVLMRDRLFDTIYHEHFSYFSFITVERVFAAHGMTLFDVEEISTHGGSLRIYAKHTEDHSKTVSTNVIQMREHEQNAGYDGIDVYENFAQEVIEVKRNILEFMIDTKRQGKTIAAYGAPAKGNTLLNYCGIRSDMIDFTVDISPHKQNHFLPGVHIPIYAPERIKEEKPDYVVVLVWNLKDEVIKQMSYIREWGGKFVTLLPEVHITD
ncbi:methyltransferase domain-containing protein [Pseudomonadota bacterium]